MKKRSTILTLFMLLCMTGVPLCMDAGSTLPSKRAFMWVDAEANFRCFSCPDSIDFYLDKIKQLGFTDVVVDVRPISGEVLFSTKYAPRLKEWNHTVRPNFDYLGRFITSAHRLGLKVHASLNVFSAGHNYFDRGLIYSGHPKWASVVYTPKGLMPITKQKEKYAAMVNPVNRSYRKYIIKVLDDLVRQYPGLDGIILDRVRYDGIEADFSSASEKGFEKYSGIKLKHFPEDIFTWKKDTTGQYVVQRGRYFNQWIEYRASVIYQVMRELRDAVKSVNPAISFGTYTGAWYPSYYEVGVNFASQHYDPSKKDWATPHYAQTGYAELIDTYITGNYYTDISISEAEQNKKGVRNETDSETQFGTWYSVEGSCRHLRHILCGKPFYGGILAEQFYNCPKKLAQSIETNLKYSDGVMVFDICHLIQHRNLWDEVKKGMQKAGLLNL
ncbi:family 10 glycosylhydrolase [Prevotella cerevisiae]|uniref:Family 10 glycosylhydrolase n=1 Tax=Segatella cerevisiae TaxID=2053716 RepID=A0ABT1BYS1_9BACT|nr:alpha amylase family protein [Segatella cerevisiae]MCO6026236.1 family 10 glycosylhydrolase [Segatella cerevisiae]